MTDIAAAIGLHQLRRAEQLRLARERLAHRYYDRLATVPGVEVPPMPGQVRTRQASGALSGPRAKRSSARQPSALMLVPAWISRGVPSGVRIRT